ncbi:MAG: roadblock/LC7 domain-containing protein [Methylovulum sp.]|nr:roadblock/LC7 domain-containing protein [Methylovulum sp.]
MLSLLLDLNEKSATIKASAIISKDGVVMAAALPEDMDEDSIGAMSAALYSVSSRSIEDLVGGVVDQIMIKGSHGYILIAHAGKEAVLTVITKTHEELDHIFLELQRTAEQLIPHI